MAMFKTKSEKKSLVITTIINVGLIALLFFFGLTYMDPPEESGIAINFGDSEVGMGDQSPPPAEETVEAQETTQEEESESSVEEDQVEQEEESTIAEEQNEEAVTQETEEAPVINKEEDKKETEAKEEKTDDDSKEKQEAKENTEKEETEEKKPDPQPEKSTSDAVKNILSGSSNSGDNTQGEGDDKEAGVKGDPDGDPNSSSYYGQGEGLDGDGNYRLGGRKALSKKKFVQDCNESGTVVVRIRVNRQGQVVSAEPGLKGTTNTSSCLLDPAKRAALATEFNSDANAPATQTGVIIYEFKLTD